jgi:ABC-2 type transport system permease protein
LLRYLRNRLRLVTSFVQPVLFLLVLGTGLASLVPSCGGVNLKTFMSLASSP